jgi:hypothetical protein
MRFDKEPLFLADPAGEEAPEFRLCARMKVDLGLLQQENALLIGMLKRIHQNGQHLAHSIADID